MVASCFVCRDPDGVRPTPVTPVRDFWAVLGDREHAARRAHAVDNMILLCSHCRALYLPAVWRTAYPALAALLVRRHELRRVRRITPAEDEELRRTEIVIASLRDEDPTWRLKTRVFQAIDLFIARRGWRYAHEAPPISAAAAGRPSA